MSFTREKRENHNPEKCTLVCIKMTWLWDRKAHVCSPDEKKTNFNKLYMQTVLHLERQILIQNGYSSNIKAEKTPVSTPRNSGGQNPVSLISDWQIACGAVLKACLQLWVFSGFEVW